MWDAKARLLKQVQITIDQGDNMNVFFGKMKDLYPEPFYF